MISSKFQLEKIYLDCIDANDNCFIAYSARIKFFFLELNYSALLFSDQDGTTKEFSSFRKTATAIIEHELEFTNTQFQFSGKWTGTEDPILSLLYEDHQHRKLLWNCHHPKTSTLITFRDRKFTGYGYAETISLPFTPQQLPIDELRWGRFLSRQHTIIWIHWKGPHPLNKIFYDGKLYEDGVFEADSIAFGNNQYELKFEKAVTITQRKLSSVFKTLPFLKLFFSKRVLNTEENKYKAHSSFTSPCSISDQGFSLFEIVTLKK